MKASAGSLVVARPRATRLRSRATDLCGSRVHFRYDHIDESQRILGKHHRITLLMQENYAKATCMDAHSSVKQLAEAVEVLGRLARTRQQVFGAHHPCTIRVQKTLERAQETLASRQK